MSEEAAGALVDAAATDAVALLLAPPAAGRDVRVAVWVGALLRSIGCNRF